MKRNLLLVIVFVLFAVSCENKRNASTSEADAQPTETAVDDGYVTYEFAGFSISVPKEFTTTDDENSMTVRFSSEATHTLNDGTATSSSAYIDASLMTGGATPNEIRETATTMKLSEEAKGETCDEPKIEGNAITMRTYHNDNDGSQVITWRWWIVSEDGKNVAGNIYYSSKEAEFYDSVVMHIVKSIKIK